MPSDHSDTFSPTDTSDQFARSLDTLRAAAPSMIRRLYDRLASPKSAHATQAYERWAKLLSEAFHLDALDAAKPSRALSRLYDVKDGDVKKLLFAVHTYYAMAIKCVLRWALEERRDDSLQAYFAALESSDFWHAQGLNNFLVDDAFSWYLDVWDSDLEEALRVLHEGVTEHTRDFTGRLRGDHFKDLYQSLVPPAVRHALGEYYTPRWLVEMTLDEVGFDAASKARILDPACGSGIFLVTAIDDILDASPKGTPDAALAHEITKAVIGFDLNPLAVLAARANYALAMGRLLDAAEPITLPVYHCDTLPPCGTVNLFSDHRHPPEIEPVDFVVGNPPWVNWQTLSQSRRDELKPLWESYGLFSLSGSKGRLGGGKKDLSMLFTYVCCDHYLSDGGRLGFLITRSVFKSTGAGDGFRRFRFDDSEPVILEPLAVHDLSDFQPFDGATTQTALLCLQKARQPFDYPVPYREWTKTCRGQLDADSGLDDAMSHMESTLLAARPVDPDHEAAPWLTAGPEVVDALTRVFGASDYRAREGVNSGGLNACFWVRELDVHDDGLTTIENLFDVGKIKIDSLRATVESERLFPLLRSGDLSRWRAVPATSIILAQDPQTRCGIAESTMKRDFPHTYSYFQHFEGDRDAPNRGTLRGRSLFRRYFKPTDPFYSMYGVGPYTMATWKVCWTRIDTRLRAAVVGPDERGRPVLPQETITFVPFDEPDAAHYFCALFNSKPSDMLVRSYSTGKGFASAHVLESVAIPAFDDSNGLHRKLSEFSRRCHTVAARGEDDEITETEREIDEMARALWGLDHQELANLLS